MAISYWQRAASYGQTRIFDILQFVAAQSTPAPRPATQQQRVRSEEPQAEEPPSPTSSTTSSQFQKE
ncbi:hypothetical protein HN873_044418, partial [Arachis hypogaea]